jgi:hypothetical protein
MTTHLLLLPIVLVMALLNEVEATYTLRRAHSLLSAHVIVAVLTSLSVGWWLAAPLLLNGPVMNWTAVAALGLMFVPTRLIVRIVHREPKWELRELMRKAALLRNSHLNVEPKAAATVARMDDLISRMERARTPETSELCDLAVANYRDWLADRHSILVLGWRLIRIHEIELELYGRQARRAELDPAEATFRWRLLRVFSWMLDIADPDLDTDDREQLESWLAELDSFRRPDTEQFIDAVQASASAWLAVEPKTRSWVSGPLSALGPTIEKEYNRLWPTWDTYYGVHFDGRDADYFSGPSIARLLTGRSPVGD